MFSPYRFRSRVARLINNPTGYVSIDLAKVRVQRSKKGGREERENEGKPLRRLILLTAQRGWVARKSELGTKSRRRNSVTLVCQGQWSVEDGLTKVLITPVSRLLHLRLSSFRMAEHALSSLTFFPLTTINLGSRQRRSIAHNRIRSEECTFRARNRDPKAFSRALNFARSWEQRDVTDM